MYSMRIYSSVIKSKFRLCSNAENALLHRRGGLFIGFYNAGSRVLLRLATFATVAAARDCGERFIFGFGCMHEIAKKNKHRALL